MTRWRRVQQPLVLMEQLGWFIRLRWGAGGAVIAAALLDGAYLDWYGRWGGMLTIGLCVLAYNLLFLLVTPRHENEAGQRRLFVLAYLQVGMDLLCLTLLTLWTGGASSPLLGFYVFHMVFASLLLTDRIAYAIAAAAAGALAGGLVLTAQFPRQPTGQAILAGWGVMLLATVYLTNHITRGLHRHRRRIERQRDRIRIMGDRIRRQQQAMVQQEKVAAIGQLAAGVAHEISNPLACIDSMLQLLQRRGGPLSEEAFVNMREQVARITQTVQQLIHFAHPSQGEQQTVPANQVVQRAFQIIRFDPRLRKIELVLSPADEALTVQVQPRAMEQVLINLILNALDAMAQTPNPRLEVRTQRAGERCIIDVIDNGHGVRPEHLGRLFEPFFTTKPVGKGTGLGLAISYSIIQSMRGNVSVESEVGKGTRFTVSLPAVRDEPTSATSQQ